MPARNTLVQLLALYTDLGSHNAQRYGHTDGRQDAANSRSYYVAVRSAKKGDTILFSCPYLYQVMTKFNFFSVAHCLNLQ